MVLAYRCVFGMYGFWLPNDPRGSGSDYIAYWELFRYGPGTKLTHRSRSVAHDEHDQALRMRAKLALRLPPAVITGNQAVQVVQGFTQAAAEAGYAVYACAILPDHVHLVVGRHDRSIRTIVGHLKGRATRLLRRAGAWPAARPLWGDHGWNVFLNDFGAVENAIDYVNQNPEKEGKRHQHWSLVTPFELPAARSGIEIVDRTRNLGGAALASHQKKLRQQQEGK